MKCPLTPDCSRAGAVPATQRTSPDPALFSAPDPTHYREYIYYHMTTPYQPSQEAQDFGRSANVKAGSGNETQLEIRCSKGGGGTMQLTKVLPLSNLVYLAAKKNDAS